ncbi:PH domain-containing protein YHR131C-like isoform X2 [Ipomoea triloba]|uniref:PH domain-containing protein YHR131C-like isoform X2 n=1 Tax=Ipomoea triloba TaxID=35885 RepID=UPI00125D9667|nr:PH domain-containing protein YHR131C-like isoform X2 [Ipomoea triloba]
MRKTGDGEEGDEDGFLVKIEDEEDGDGDEDEEDDNNDGDEDNRDGEEDDDGQEYGILGMSCDSLGSCYWVGVREYK